MESSKAGSGYLYLLISNCNTLCLVASWAVRLMRKAVCMRNICLARDVMGFVIELSKFKSRAVLFLLPVFQRV